MLNKRRMLTLCEFQNSSNFEAHYRGTGPEIWKQTRGNVDAFVSGAGELFLMYQLHHTIQIFLGLFRHRRDSVGDGDISEENEPRPKDRSFGS